METIRFIPVKTAEDIETLAAIADEIWHEFFTAILTPDQIDYMVERFQSVGAVTDQIVHRNYEYYLVRAGERNVGYTGIQPGDGKLFLSKIYLYRDARGKGYASRTFAFLEDICRRRGLSAIWLTVNRHNDNSVAVYRKKGFGVIREQVVDIGGGFVMDDFVMEKPIVAEK